MRSLIVVTLALCPVLLHAQANSPAQPSASPTLQSKLVRPAEFVSAGADHSASVTPLRISTGVVAPKLINPLEISTDQDSHSQLVPYDRIVVVGMVVDKTGKPTDLQILKSTDPEANKTVLAAVSEYRFKPGTLDNQPADVPLNLQITLRTGAR
jgi:TonB family protein